MRHAHTTISGLLLSILLSGAASARCEGAVMLGGLHDAYLATLNGDVETQRQAAQTLLVFAGIQDTATLARQVARSGVELSATRLGDALADAREIATSTLSGMRPDVIDFRHGLNVDWLADIYLASRCQNSTALTGITPITLERPLAGKAANPDVPFIERNFGTGAKLLLALLVLVLLFGGYKLSRSYAVRAMRVERMPRFPISLPLDLAFTDPDGHMQEVKVEALDISRGGLKLHWPNPPPPGTLATMPVLATQRMAHVVWANAHYAGIVFEVPLTGQELSTLKDQQRPG